MNKNESYYFYYNERTMLESNGGPGTYIGSLKEGTKVKIVEICTDPMQRFRLRQSGYSFANTWINIEYKYSKSHDDLDTLWVSPECLKKAKSYISTNPINLPEIMNEANSTIRK